MRHRSAMFLDINNRSSSGHHRVTEAALYQMQTGWSAVDSPVRHTKEIPRE